MQLLIVMPALILAVSTVFQAMEYYIARQAAETAARQGADAARVLGATGTDGATRANSVLTQLGSPLEAVNVNVTRNGTTVVATVTGRPHQVVPGFALTVTANATAPAEQYSPPP